MEVSLANYYFRSVFSPYLLVVDFIFVSLAVNQYAFCVRSEDDVSAELVSWSTELAAQCPSSYSSLEMVISRTNSLATTSDLVWRLGHGETTTNAIYLFHNDADTKLGSCKLLRLYVDGCLFLVNDVSVYFCFSFSIRLLECVGLLYCLY